MDQSKTKPRNTQSDIDHCRMVTYVVDRKFSGKQDEGKRFCERLLKYTEEVEEIFGNPRYERPILECVEMFVSSCNNECKRDILQLINNKLEECDQIHVQVEEVSWSPCFIESEFDKKEGHFDLDFNNRRSFKPAFNEISRLACEKVRLIAHFLLDYDEIQRIFIDYQANVKERLGQVLERWREKTSPEKRTWKCLKALLLFLGKYNVVKVIEGNNDSMLCEIWRKNQKSWEDEKCKRYAADIPINTPTNWSIIHCFIECMKYENKSFSKKEILKNIKREVTENLEWYHDILSGDLTEMVGDYVSAGTNSQKNEQLILRALSNAFRQSIIILKKDEDDLYQLMDEKDVLYPDRMKSSLGILHFYADKNHCFHPLVNVTEKKFQLPVRAKCDIEVLHIKDTYVIIEIPDVTSIDAIILEEIGLDNERKVNKIKFDFDVLKSEKYGGYIYIMLYHNWMENQNYRCSLDMGKKGVITSRLFSLEEKVFELMEYKDYIIFSHKEIGRSSETAETFRVFKENFLCCQSKDKGKKLEASKWISCCDRYAENNLFLKDKGYFRPWPIFPNIFMNVLKSKTEEVAECFRDALLTQTGKTSAGGIIIMNYDSRKHKDFITKDKSVAINQKVDNNILIVHEELGAVLNIRVTEQTERKDIMKECLSSSQDADDIGTLMNFLLKHENFGGSKVQVASLVAAPYLHPEDLDKKLFDEQHLICSGCGPRILTSREFDPDDHHRNLQEFLKSLPKVLKSTNGDQNSHLFIRKIIAQIAGFIANTSIKVPSHSDDPHEQLMHLQANEDQIQVIIDPRRHKVIYGPFSCGKTIIGMQQSEFLARMAEVPTIVFYVCYDPYSLLDYTIEKHLRSLKLSTVEDGLVEFRVTNASQLAIEMGKNVIPSVSEILAHIYTVQGREQRVCHVCVDEVHISLMTDKEVLLLNENLERLKTNYVTLIFQPFHEIVRRHPFSLYEILFGQKFDRNRVPGMNVVKLLTEKKLNMVPLRLSKNMRNSSGIHNMLEVAKVMIGRNDIRFSRYLYFVYMGSCTQLFEFSDGIGHNFDGNPPQVLFIPASRAIKRNLQSFDIQGMTQMKILQLAICLQSVEYGDCIICCDKRILNFIEYALDVTNKRYLLYACFLKETLPSPGERKGAADAIENGKAIIVTDSYGYRGLQTRRVIIPLFLNEMFSRCEILENAARATTEILFIIMDVTELVAFADMVASRDNMFPRTFLFYGCPTFKTILYTCIRENLVNKCKQNWAAIDLTQLLSRLPTEDELVQKVSVRPVGNFDAYFSKYFQAST